MSVDYVISFTSWSGIMEKCTPCILLAGFTRIVLELLQERISRHLTDTEN